MRVRNVALMGIVAAFAAGVFAAEEKKFDLPDLTEKPHNTLDLTGTRRGPHGSFLPPRMRKALRKRVKKEAWATKHFEENILPKAQERDPMSLGVAYVVTGKKHYADTLRDMIIYQLNLFDDEPRWRKYGKVIPLPGKGHGGARGRPNRNWAWAMNLPDWIPNAYDLIADSLDKKSDRRIRAGIAEQLRAARHYYTHWWHHNPNQKMCSLKSAFRWATAVGWDEMIDYLLNHGPGQRNGGLFAIMNDYIRGKRFGIESGVYHYLVGQAFTPIAEVMYRYNKTDLWKHQTRTGASIQSYMDGFIDLAYPIEKDGRGKGAVRVSNWGHGSTCVTHSHSDVYLVNQARFLLEGALRSMFRQTGDKKYEYFLSLMPPERKEPTLEDFLYGWRKIGDDVPPPSAPSIFWKESGLAFLRFPEDGSYWNDGIAVLAHGSESSRGHVADPFILLHGKGRLLYPEWLQKQYEHGGKVGWNMQRVSKNTMMIDGRTGTVGYSTSRHSYDPEVKFVSIRCCPYLEGEMERCLMLTREYLLDVFRAKTQDHAYNPRRFRGIGRCRYWDSNQTLAKGRVHHLGMSITTDPVPMPESHTFDYLLHGIGLQFQDAPSLYKPSTEFGRSFWVCRWVQNERVRGTGDAVQIDWFQHWAGRRPPGHPAERHNDLDRQSKGKWFTDHAGVRMTMLGEPGTKVFVAEGPMRGGPVDRDLYPEEVLPMVAVRRTGKQALYTAVHEPYKERDGAEILEVSYLHKPSLNESTPAVGVKVVGPDYVDRCFVTLDLPGLSRLEKPRPKPEKLADKNIEKDLTGGWLFTTDPDEKGAKAGWERPGADRSKWTRWRAGVGWHALVPGYYGWAWYAKEIEVPAELKGKKAQIYFHGADQETWVYLNGKEIFEHHYWEKPFLVDLEPHARFGEKNLIVVKIYKDAWMAGLYGDVYLVTKGRKAETKSAEGYVWTRPEGPYPVTTAACDRFGGKIAFRAQAYLREKGGKLVVRGNVENLALYAPDIAPTDALTLNGKAVKYEKAGPFLLYGDAGPGATIEGVVCELVATGRTGVIAGEPFPVHVRVRNLTGAALAGASIVLVAADGKTALGKAVKLGALAAGAAGKADLQLMAPMALAGKSLAFSVKVTAGGKEAAISKPRSLGVSSPVAVSLPTGFVNLPAEGGGVMRVRLRNQSKAQVSGTLSVAPSMVEVKGRKPVPAKGLAMEQPSKPFRLEGRGTTELEFGLKVEGATAGKTVPLDLRVAVADAAKAKPVVVTTSKVDVAVGIVVEEIKESYHDRPHYYLFKEDNYDRFRVRAPGYTVEVDRTSGTSRALYDTDGKARTTLDWYRFGRTRGLPWRSYERASVPEVRGKGNRRLFGWNTKAGYVDIVSPDPSSALMTFTDEKVEHALTWIFRPDRIDFRARGPEGDPSPYFYFDRLDIGEVGYRYRIETRRGPREPFMRFRLDKPLEPLVSEEQVQKEPSEPLNVLSNNDFSKLAGEGDKVFPEGWRITSGPASAIRAEKATWASGGHALRVDLGELAGKALHIQRRDLPAKAGRRYRFLIRMRHEDVKCKSDKWHQFRASPWIVLVGAGINHRDRFNYAPHLWPGGMRELFEMRSRKSPLATSSGAMRLTLQIHSLKGMTGTLWIDSLEVLESAD